MIKNSIKIKKVVTKSKVTIPKQLRSIDFGFVKLRKKSKKPFEPDWHNDPHTYREIQTWIDNGNNYGVIGGYGDLIVIDADTKELDKAVKDKLPDTFTVKTPQKGHHYYYKCKDIKGKIVLDSGKKRFGEIISSGSQVVGAGSIHPDTGTKYQVANNIEIAEISKEEIFNNFADFIPSETAENYAYSKLTEEYGEPFHLKDNKLISFNEQFWAGLHDQENIQLYEPSEQIFYRYDESTGLYKDVSVHEIKKDVSKRILDVSRDHDIRDLEKKRNNPTLNNIVGQLRGISEKKEAFDRNNKKIVHLANGVLVFNADDDTDFVSFSPEFYSRNQSPILFDETAECPRFINELLYPATSSDDAILIQKYTGLCLLGNNLSQRILILDGMAGRGKSTISLIIQRLVGLSNVTQLRTSHLDDRFELYRYLKKTLLVGVDVPGDFLSKKSSYVLKALVGDDILDAEQKGGTENFPLQGKFCVVITSNSRLQVRLDGDHGAWKRRLLIVRFESPPPKKTIPKFVDLLIAEEGSGILNWALIGLQMVLDDIKEYGGIQLSGNQTGVVDALLAESDSLRHFLSDCVVRDDNCDISVSEIKEAYAEYCPKKKWTAKPITMIEKELEGLMLELFQTTKSNSILREGKSVRGFRRVRLKH